MSWEDILKLKYYRLMARHHSNHSTNKDWFGLEIYDDLESAEKALEEHRAKPHMKDFEYKIEEEDDLRELFGERLQ